MVKKPKDGIMGTDEGHLAYFKGWKKRGNQGRTGGYPNFLYACIYIYVGCMLAFSTLKFSLDISISWMGQSIYSPILAILAIYDNRNCGCFEEWSLCGCMG